MKNPLERFHIGPSVVRRIAIALIACLSGVLVFWHAMNRSERGDQVGDAAAHATARTGVLLQKAQDALILIAAENPGELVEWINDNGWKFDGSVFYERFFPGNNYLLSTPDRWERHRVAGDAWGEPLRFAARPQGEGGGGNGESDGHSLEIDIWSIGMNGVDEDRGGDDLAVRISVRLGVAR